MCAVGISATAARDERDVCCENPLVNETCERSWWSRPSTWNPLRRTVSNVEPSLRLRSVFLVFGSASASWGREDVRDK